MLRKNLGLLALVVGSASASLVACGGDDGGDGGGAGGAGGSGASGGSGGTAGTSGSGGGNTGPNPTCTDTPADCILPAAPPTGGTPAAGDTNRVIAIKKLYLGATDRSGSASPTAWKDYGFNLDGIISTRTGSNHCKPATGANPATVKTDGNGGIDNSFGANLLPIIDTVASGAEDSINESIAGGEFTVMVRITNYTEGANVTGLNAALYGGAELGSPPAWDGSDQWPVIPELLNGGDINSPKVTFSGAYVSGGTFVAGGGDATLTLAISIQGFTLNLVIRKAVISMNINATGATMGTIGGVLNTEDLITELGKVAGTFDPSLCPGSSTFDSIAGQIRAASDIMADGTNGDDSVTCNGISIGLGFDGGNVQLGSVAEPATPGDNPCD